MFKMKSLVLLVLFQDFFCCSGEENCTLVQDLRTIISLRFMENYIANEKMINPTTLHVSIKSPGQLKSIFETPKTKKGMCVKDADAIKLILYDEDGIYQELDVMEKLKMTKVEKMTNVKKNGQIEIDPCGVYKVVLSAQLHNGGNITSTSTFGPYYKELEDDQIQNINILEKMKKKTENILFSVDDSGVKVSWDKVCGQSMAIYVKDTAKPIRILNATELEEKEIVIDLDPCQVVRRESMFAEMFLPAKYQEGLTYFEHSNAKEDLVIGPDASNFKEIYRNGTLFILDESDNFLFTSESKDCFSKEIYTVYVMKDEKAIQEGVPFENHVDIAKYFRDMETCTEYDIYINVSYSLQNNPGELVDMNLLSDTFLTNTNGTFSSGEVWVEERQVNNQTQAFIRVKGEPCKFSYTLTLRSNLSSDLISIGSQKFKNGELPVNEVQQIMACTVYELRILEQDTPFHWNNAAPLITPDLVIKPSDEDENSAKFHVDGYQNCNMSEFIVQCRFIGSNKILNNEDSWKVIHCTKDCVHNSLNGTQNYECRARVNLKDDSSSPWTDWIPVKDSNSQRRGRDDWDLKNDDEESDYVTVPVIIAGILFIFFIAGLAHFICKRNKKRNIELNMYTMTARPPMTSVQSRISAQSRALLEKEKEEKEKNTVAEENMRRKEEEVHPPLAPVEGVHPPLTPEDSSEVHDYTKLLNSDEEGLPVPSVTILIEKPSQSSSNQSFSLEKMEIDDHERIEIDGHGRQLESDDHERIEIDGHGRQLESDDHERIEIDGHGLQLESDDHEMIEIDGHGHQLESDDHERIEIDGHGHQLEIDDHGRIEIDGHQNSTNSDHKLPPLESEIL